MSQVTARTFNQSPSAVKAMTKDGPVFVTDRGRPSVVVLAIADYERLVGSGTILDSLRMDPGPVEVDFEPVVSRDLGRVADL